MNGEKIIALCSGGFDSIVMLHMLVEKEGYSPEVLFFDYGQVSAEREKECALKICEKFSLNFNCIKLPDFSWSKSTLRTGKIKSDKDQYLEMRNLIFLSYAVSFAESIGAKKIYAAFIENGFKDANKPFVQGFNFFMKPHGIELITPFIEYDKAILAPIARAYGITREDFFSCNTPILKNGELVPCGKCGDCDNIDFIFGSIIADNTPIKAWLSGNKEKFKELFLESPVTKLKVYNLPTAELKDRLLSLEERCSALKKFINYGVKDIMLIENSITLDVKELLAYYKYLKNFNVNVELSITEEFIIQHHKKLSEIKFDKIHLTITRVTLETKKALKFINKNRIPVQVHLDILINNYEKTLETLEHLNKKFGVKEFYLHPITIDRINYSNLFKELLPLDLEEYCIFFPIKSSWVDSYIEGDEVISDYIDVFMTSACNTFGSIVLLPKMYNDMFESEVVLTLDGNVYATILEAINKIPIGNVKDLSVEDIIKLGKKKTLSSFES